MTSSTITNLSAVSTIAEDDKFAVVDISDTTQASSGSTKRASLTDLRNAAERIVLPPSTSWTAFNSASITTSNNQRVITSADTGSTISLKGETRTMPAAPFTITAKIEVAPLAINYIHTGLCYMDSGDDMVTCATITDSGLPKIVSEKWNSPTSYNSTYTSLAGRSFQWFRITYGGAPSGNRTYYVSPNGVDWFEVSTATTAYDNFMTPTKVGWFLEVRDASSLGTFTCAARLASWEES